MVRWLIFLFAVAVVGLGMNWLADNPGDITLTWRGVEYEFSLMVGLGVVLALALVLSFVWWLMRLILRTPSLISFAARARRREKGFTAISRGLIAIGSGDWRAANRHAADARKFLADEPLTKLLRAQAAQLNGDRAAAISAFHEMIDHRETHAFGLRGLYVEAHRASDHDAALDYAHRAHKYAALPWAAQAVLDDRAGRGDWAGALATVESNAALKLLDKPTANRWRAVLKTAIAQDLAQRDPKGALALATEALALAPGLVPAAALAGKLYSAAGDYRRASKVIETAYRETPHPDLADAYLRVRQGDSAGDRLARARSLARVAPFDPETQMTIARAALEARDLPAARAAMAPLLRGDPDQPRPTARACLLAADIEEAAGDEGGVREWLNRAARAPRDRAWVAEGVITDHWAPVSPSGVLDAFVWRTPDERLTAQEPPLRPAIVATPPAIEPPAPAPTAAPEPAPVAAAAPPAAPPSVAAPPPSAPAPAAPPPAAAAAGAPPREAARTAPVAARSGPNVVMMPSAAPDDPGPERPDATRSPYGLFARE